ncbi:MAG: phosphopentomutase [Syntrophomonadaceae bacterium]|mgnify:CR=1 FL=1|nr:phosphopentomutase [Syntrophomonadaceae bacterium]
MKRRVILIVLDSVGIGEMPDSCQYGDGGCNTLVNTARAVGGLKIPNLQQLGIGNITLIDGTAPVESPQAAYGKMEEQSAGKDTTTGHWEMMGIILERPFPTYPQGFPIDLLQKFEQLIGRPAIGNKAASGTEIIKELGEYHMKTGYPIVYTSADSVFQIAAHEEIIPLPQLYEMCQTARNLLQGEHAVGRVIARPFIGQPGNFVRTAHRHDYSLQPEKNILDYIQESGESVIGVGKIKDIFAGRGITSSYAIENNDDGVDKIIQAMQMHESGLIFANLIDFDQLYGHRNDPHGYAAALEAFDRRLPDIINTMQDEDILILTADHGCDPTFAGTDHTREYVPLLVYGTAVQPQDLGIRTTFADIGQSLAGYLRVKVEGLPGNSFL